MSDPRPRTYHVFGNLIKFLAFPSETAGGSAILDIRVAPSAGAPPHHHAGEDENFFVLEGEFKFSLNGKSAVYGVGDFVKIPIGAVHSFSCTSERPGRLLGVATPGTGHEIFFTEAGESVPEGTTEFPIDDGPPNFAKIAAAASKAKMTLLT